MYSIYQVMAKDTLESISDMFETDVRTLEKLNGISSVNAGQMIVVPRVTASSNYNIYTIEKGDNLYNIAKKYSVDLKKLQYLNGLEEDDYIYPGEDIMVPKEGVEIYLVKEYETLLDVSNEAGVSVKDIVEANDKIYLCSDQILFFKKSKNS